MDAMKGLNDRTIRILDVMKEVDMNATQFSEAIGIQRAAMSHIMSGRNNASVDVIAKIIERFKTINPGWLLTGEGPMKLTESNNNTDNTWKSTTMNTARVPNLFDQENEPQTEQPLITLPEEKIPTEIRFTDEIRQGETVEAPKEISKVIEKEVIVYKERPVKTIDKLLIFYSDHTYETFIPEKNEEKGRNSAK